MASAVTFGASFTYYTSQAAFQSAIAGRQQQSIDFNSLPTGDYSPLVTGGVTFSGDLRSGVAVSSESVWTMPFFGSVSGNSLAAIGEMGLVFGQPTYAIGFQVGVSFIAATNCITCSADITILPMGGTPGVVTAAPGNLFPFIGLISNAPISQLTIQRGSFLTIDNVLIAGDASSGIPEPSARIFAGTAGVFLLAAKRRLASRSN